MLFFNVLTKLKLSFSVNEKSLASKSM